MCAGLEARIDSITDFQAICSRLPKLQAGRCERPSRLAATSDESRSKGRALGDVERMCDPMAVHLAAKVLSGRKHLLKTVLLIPAAAGLSAIKRSVRIQCLMLSRKQAKHKGAEQTWGARSYRTTRKCSSSPARTTFVFQSRTVVSTVPAIDVEI